MSIFQMVKLHLIQQYTIKKLSPIIMFMLLYTSVMLLPLRDIASTYQTQYSYGIIALVLTGKFYPAYMAIGVVLLFNVLPIENSFQFWLILKAGYLKWMITQVIYLTISSFLFVFVNVIMILGLLFPYVQFNNDWGKLIYSIAENRIEGSNLLLEYSQYSAVTLDYYSPDKAFIQSIVLWVLVVLLFGMVILSFNYIYKQLGTCLASGMIVLALFIQFANGIWVQFVSPLTWLSIYYIKHEVQSGLLSYEQVLIRCCSVIISLIMLICVVVIKKRGGAR